MALFGRYWGLIGSDSIKPLKTWAKLGNGVYANVCNACGLPKLSRRAETCGE